LLLSNQDLPLAILSWNIKASLFIVLMTGIEPGRINGRGEFVNCFTPQKQSRCWRDLRLLDGVGRLVVLRDGVMVVKVS